jgi:hypothetical protein
MVTMALLEALRFRPQAEALPRRCRRGATLAEGTRRERAIAPGDVVIAVTKSAMLDRRAVARPSRFSMERPDDDYLHFGYGLHRCFGEHIARAQLAAIATALFSREIGSLGGLTRSGPFPAHLPVAVTGPPVRTRDARSSGRSGRRAPSDGRS